MGLTKDRMTLCDALFFYELPVPIGDPSCSGIADDPHMGYCEMVLNNANIYAYGFSKNRGGVAAKFEYTAYSKLAAAKISNISIYGFTYLTSNLHGHFVAEYRI